MDIIKVNKFLYYLYRPPQKGIFDSENISKVRVPQLDKILPLHTLKLRVIAYKKVQAEDSSSINKNEDNNKNGSKDEALKVKFAAIKAILDQGNNTNNTNKNGEVNKDNK